LAGAGNGKRGGKGDGKSPALVSVDIGTTNTRALLYRGGTGVAGEGSAACSTSYPRPGYVEQDAEEVLAAVAGATRALLDRSGVSPREIDAVVFDGVLQSLVSVDRAGAALAPAMLWADKRSLPQSERLKARYDNEEARRRTGCPLHPMYFPSRLAWLREEAPDIWNRAARFVSLKELVVQRLTGVSKTDRSIASGTGAWNMASRDWDADLLALVGLSSSGFPECVEPTTVVGGLTTEGAAALGLREGTPVVIGASDGAMAHLGSVGVDGQRMSLTVATSGAIRRSIRAPRVLPGTEAWCYYLGEDSWIQGGVVHGAGNVLRWFGDTLMPPTATAEDLFSEIGRIAAEVPPGADGLRFLPLLGGERCPHDRPDARGSLWGLDFSHTRGHVARALMEGLAWYLSAVYRMLVPGDGPDLVVNGGIVKSPTWLQIVADVLGKTLWLPRVTEAAAWGGALVGLRALGVISSLEEAAPFIGCNGGVHHDPGRHEIYATVIESCDELYRKLYGTPPPISPSSSAGR
jgi:gluconokinase